MAQNSGLKFGFNATIRWSVVFFKKTFNRILVLLSLAVLLAACSFNPERTEPLPCEDCECGEQDIIDERDGRVYETVKIGSKCWMKENLNVGVQVFRFDSMISYNGVIEKFCYNGDCDLYGGYYTYDEAIQDDPNVSRVLDGDYNVRGICPKGWHLPSVEEFNELLAEAKNDISELIRTGTNGTQFSADLGGVVVPNNPLYGSLAVNYAYYRTSVPASGSSVYVLYIRMDANIIEVTGDATVGGTGTQRSVGVCVRCVKD